MRTSLAAPDEELKRLRPKAQAAQERRAELQVALARAESDLKHLEETCQKELETTLAELAEGIETVPDEAALAEFDAQIHGGAAQDRSPGAGESAGAGRIRRSRSSGRNS